MQQMAAHSCWVLRDWTGTLKQVLWLGTQCGGQAGVLQKWAELGRRCVGCHERLDHQLQGWGLNTAAWVFSGRGAGHC